jgi:FixJ family two-component response regulator
VTVVDDDPSVRRALKRLIMADRFAVETFASGREFLESDTLGRSACVILDVHLGDMNGFEVQERLAAGGARIPLIFITAFDEQATRDRAQRAGAVALLRKPFDDTELLGAIREALHSE